MVAAAAATIGRHTTREWAPLDNFVLKNKIEEKSQ